MIKFYMRLCWILFVVTISYSSGYSQASCPFITMEAPFNLPCTQPCSTLHANYLKTYETTTYAIQPQAYAPAPYNAGTPVIVADDDVWSGVVDIPFTFCFFGQQHNQLVIGANGLISFDIANANTGCVWNLQGGQTIPTNALYTNSIMAPYHDIDPTNQGAVFWNVIGSWPCRKFVVSWNQVPYYGDINSSSPGSCGSPLFATQQVVLYEWSNIIEINIQNKQTCSGWNGGLAIEGIQNAAGTVAYVIPGRNNAVWTANNESYWFVPTGNPTYTFSWLLNGAPFASTDNTTICPSSYGLYTAQVVYTECDGDVHTFIDDAFIGTVSLQVNIDSVKNAACSQNNGKLYASYNTTSAILSYGWTPGPQNTTSYTTAPPGTYIFSTSIAGCTRSDTATIIDSGSLSVVVNDSAFTSCNPPGNQGVLRAQPIGGVSPYTYAWSNSQSGQYATGLTSGSYSVTVTDFQGCTGTDAGNVTYTIQSPSLLPPLITNVTCNGGSDGSIVAITQNMQSPVNFVWSGGLPNNDTVTNLSSGPYTVTATDANGCSASGSYNISQPTAIVLANPVITNASCAAGGSITASASGGAGSLTYTWSNSQTGATISNLAGGSYTLTVSNASGCSVTASYTVGAAPSAVVFNAPVIVDVSCNGGSDGSITASASGGTGVLGYLWSNSQTGAQITGLTAGTYSLSVSDVSGCSATTSYVVNEPAALALAAPAITDVTCFAGGSITASASGGTGTLNYNWSNSQSGASISGLSAGAYSVTITDQNSCSISTTYNVSTASGAVVIGNGVVADASCNGSSDGSVTINPSGGTGVLTSTWSNSQTGNTISGLSSGAYSVTVSDATGCSATATFNVAEPTPLALNAPVIQNIGCTGAINGAITASAAGGTPGYTYSWVQQSNSQAYNGAALTGLSADTYDLTVTDLNSCSITDSYVVLQVTPLTFNTSYSDVSCFGGNDGSATVNILTGTLPYSYNWNGTGAQANATLAQQLAGVINVTITDANCSATATFTITEPSQVTLTGTAQQNVSCNGGSDGSITVAANGGTLDAIVTDYVYLWSNTQTGPSATALAAGSYSVTASDANGCSASLSFTITEASPVTLNPTTQDALCFAAPNGSISANPAGGNTPYSFLWSNAQTTPTATSLLAGSYSVTVTDASGCTASAAAGIGEPTDVLINTVVTAVKCPGQNDGTITVTASGGVSPYSYSATQDFANFIFTTDGVIIGLAPGDYSVIVSDDNGCTDVVLVTVPDATPDNFLATTDSTSCYGDNYNDGTAEIIATSIQNGPYQFSMDGGPLQYSGNFYNLSAGAHTITAISFNGCTSQVPVLVAEPLPIVVDVNPDTLFLNLGEGEQVQVTQQNAASPNYLWTPTVGLSCIDCPNPYVTAYESGNYVIEVSSVNGTATCYGYATLRVEVAPHEPVFVPNSFSPNGDGNNDLFLVYGTDIRTVDLKIFNRWGELVFVTNNQMEGWDGAYKGQIQVPQVFTYDVRVTFLDGKKEERKGTVTLIR
jgi:gliding motility-associated-like protein